jgi:LysM repeat protein
MTISIIQEDFFRLKVLYQPAEPPESGKRRTFAAKIRQIHTMLKHQPLFSVLFLCFFFGRALGQVNPPPLLKPTDSLFLVVKENSKILMHTVKPKQTLFSISRFYGLSVEEILENNPQLADATSVPLGLKVAIPVPNRAIKRYKKADFNPKKNTPIYYQVQAGDNLYHICKRYFNMELDSIVKRNRLKNNSIKPGQLLMVGWLGTEGIPVEWRPARPVTQGGVLQTRYEELKVKMKEYSVQGVCFWQKESRETGHLYALHREAAIGSIIAVSNPMYNVTVYCKVVGRIPDGHDSNVVVIVSPEAARKLGAIDPRFFVKLKYLK